MRWGILTNLVIILAVSGLLLFVVYSASLARAAIDSNTRQSDIILELIKNRITGADSPEQMWASVKSVCRSHADIKISLYDEAGKYLGGCRVRNRNPEPVRMDVPKRVRVVGSEWPTVLLNGFTLVIDSVGSFGAHASAIRLYVEVPASIFGPAWKFFAAYLVLTQSTLFFLGYILFHRTVIGPLAEATLLADKAAGLTGPSSPHELTPVQGDIQAISAGLKRAIHKIIGDREKMQALVDRLQETNKNLEAAQQGLIRSEKLAGIGRLAAGLAHEIGNPLQIVMGYLELLHKKSGSENNEILSRMDQELRRINEIIKRLLEFARPMPMKIDLFDINGLIADCVTLIKESKAFRHCEFQLEPADNIPLIKSEPEKIRQIIINLLFNASDAISQDGGKITLITREYDGGAEILVADNGHGISPEDLGKIFDPFFTTKDPGKGTGLGLAVCLGLAESLGANIEITSNVDAGTEATLRIPNSGGLEDTADTNAFSIE